MGNDRRGVEAYTKHVAAIAAGRALRYAEEHHEYAEEILADSEFLSVFSYMGEAAGVNTEKSLREILGGTYRREELNRIIAKNLGAAIYDSGFKHAPMWDAEEKAAPPEGQRDGNAEHQRYFAAVSNLNLIDIHALSWDQIIEFRKDPDSRAALRRLRLFFSENYEGKDRSYIVDDLLARVEKQEEVAKLWGLSTVTRSLGVAISDKSVLTTTLGGLAVAASGAPLAAAAAAGLVITAGSCLIEFGNAVVERRTEALNRPTEYLTELRKRLGR